MFNKPTCFHASVIDDKSSSASGDHRHYIASLKTNAVGPSATYLFVQPLERIESAEFSQRINHRLIALLPSLGLPADDTTTVLCLPVKGYPLGSKFVYRVLSSPTPVNQDSQAQLEQLFHQASPIMNSVF